MNTAQHKGSGEASANILALGFFRMESKDMSRAFQDLKRDAQKNEAEVPNDSNVLALSIEAYILISYF